MKNELIRARNHVAELQKDLAAYRALLDDAVEHGDEGWHSFEDSLPADRKPLHVRVRRLLGYDTWLRKHRTELETTPTRSRPFGTGRSKVKEELVQFEDALLREMSSTLIRITTLVPGSIDRQVAQLEVADLAMAMICGYKSEKLREIRDDTSNESLYLLLNQWLESHPVEDEASRSERAGLPTSKGLEELRALGKAQREEILRTMETYGAGAKKAVVKALQRAKAYVKKFKEDTNNGHDGDD